MGETFIFLLCVLALFALLYWDWRKLGRSTKLKMSADAEQKPPTLHPKVDIDPFLLQVMDAKAEAAASVAAALMAAEKEFADRHSQDLKLKERLSQFARDHRLDAALIKLWDEIRSYPSWSKRADFAELNKLSLIGIEGTKKGDTQTVQFAHGPQTFKISRRSWMGIEGEDYADYALYEDGEEVFAISCESDYNEHYALDRCLSIDALKKRGNWAKFLLENYAKIEIESQVRVERSKYFGAEKIKSRFEER